MLSQWLITIGLSLDVIGAILVFTFAVGPKVSRGGTSALLLEHDDPIGEIFTYNKTDIILDSSNVKT